MKKWLVCFALVAAAAAFGGEPFSGVDVGKLKPVELIAVRRERGRILVETDTGDQGSGKDLNGAMADLRLGADGVVFLETAEYLLAAPNALGLLPELGAVLRPGCAVCIADGWGDWEKVASYLRAHEPAASFKEYRVEALPVLRIEGEDMRLVE